MMKNYHLGKLNDALYSTVHKNYKIKKAYNFFSRKEYPSSFFNELVKELKIYTTDEFKDFDFPRSLEFAKIIYSMNALMEDMNEEYRLKQSFN